MADTFKYVQTQSITLYGAGASIGDTSLRVVNFNDLSGTALAITDFGSLGYGTIEPGTSAQEEPITFTGVTNNGDGTSTLTGVKRQLGKAPYTQTSGLGITHAGGTTVVLSNTAGFYDAISGKGNDETISGIWTFTASPVVPTPTTDYQASTKKYVDDTVIAGAAKATDTVYGISKLSVAAASSTQPIVVGTNDNRVSPVSLATVTANIVAALAGTGTPNGTTGKFVTNDDTSATASNNKIVRYGAGATLKASPTAASVSGDVVVLDAANKLPAVDGSQLTGILYPSKNGIIVPNVGGTNTITHGLGRTPQTIRFVTTSGNGSNSNAFSHGTYNGSGYAMVHMVISSGISSSSSAVFGIVGEDLTHCYKGTVTTLNSTQFVTTWTQAANPPGANAAQFCMWEAM